MQTRKNYALIEQCTIEEIQQKLSEFPKKYHHFQFPTQKNTWKFCIISEDIHNYVVQLVDKTFEPPRGNVPSSDQPYICVHFHQEGEKIKLVYWLKWQKWKLTLVVLGLFMYFSIPMKIIRLSTSCGLLFWGSVGLILLGLFVFVFWFTQNIHHDRLTKKVFEELLQRNFACVFKRTVP